MEVLVSHCDNVPEGCMLALTAGAARRMAPLANKQKFAFHGPSVQAAAADGGGGMKVEVLMVKGSARIDASELAPGVGGNLRGHKVDVPLRFIAEDGSVSKEQGFMTLGLSVRPAQVARTQSETRLTRGREGQRLLKKEKMEKRWGSPDVDSGMESGGQGQSAKLFMGLDDSPGKIPRGRHNMALEARSYLEEHRIMPFVEELMRVLVKQQPEDPWSCIYSLFPPSAGGIKKLPEDFFKVKAEEKVDDRIPLQPVNEAPKLLDLPCRPEDSSWDGTGKSVPLTEDVLKELPSKSAPFNLTSANLKPLGLGKADLMMNINIDFTIEHVDFLWISQNVDLFMGLMSQVQETIAFKAGVHPSQVEVEFGEGSLLVHSKIRCIGEKAGMEAKSRIDSDTEGLLKLVESAVLHVMNNVPGAKKAIKPEADLTGNLGFKDFKSVMRQKLQPPQEQSQSHHDSTRMPTTAAMSHLSGPGTWRSGFQSQNDMRMSGSVYEHTGFPVMKPVTVANGKELLRKLAKDGFRDALIQGNLADSLSEAREKYEVSVRSSLQDTLLGATLDGALSKLMLKKKQMHEADQYEQSVKDDIRSKLFKGAQNASLEDALEVALGRPKPAEASVVKIELQGDPLAELLKSTLLKSLPNKALATCVEQTIVKSRFREHYVAHFTSGEAVLGHVYSKFPSRREVCSCGATLMPDQKFCRKCGKHRQCKIAGKAGSDSDSDVLAFSAYNKSYGTFLDMASLSRLCGTTSPPPPSQCKKMAPRPAFSQYDEEHHTFLDAATLSRLFGVQPRKQEEADKPKAEEEEVYEEVAIEETQLDFAFDSIDFNELMSSPEMFAQVEKQLREAIAEEMGCLPEEVELDLSAGSLKVKAKVKTPAPDPMNAKGAEVAGQGASKGGNFAGKISELVASVPGIEDCLVAGATDLGMTPLEVKTEVKIEKRLVSRPASKAASEEPLSRPNTGKADSGFDMLQSGCPTPLSAGQAEPSLASQPFSSAPWCPAREASLSEVSLPLQVRPIVELEPDPADDNATGAGGSIVQLRPLSAVAASEVFSEVPSIVGPKTAPDTPANRERPSSVGAPAPHLSPVPGSEVSGSQATLTAAEAEQVVLEADMHMQQLEEAPQIICKQMPAAMQKRNLKLRACGMLQQAKSGVLHDVLRMTLLDHRDLPELSAEGISLNFVVQNMDYHQLAASPSLMEAVEAAMKQSIAAEAGEGIRPEHIVQKLSAGSVMVDATIVPPLGHNVAGMQAKLAAGRLTGTVAGKLARIDGINTVSSGPLQVSKVEVARVSTKESMLAAKCEVAKRSDIEEEEALVEKELRKEREIEVRRQAEEEQLRRQQAEEAAERKRQQDAFLEEELRRQRVAEEQAAKLRKLQEEETERLIREEQEAAAQAAEIERRREEQEVAAQAAERLRREEEDAEAMKAAARVTPLDQEVEEEAMKAAARITPWDQEETVSESGRSLGASTVQMAKDEERRMKEAVELATKIKDKEDAAEIRKQAEMKKVSDILARYEPSEVSDVTGGVTTPPQMKPVSSQDLEEINVGDRIEVINDLYMGQEGMAVMHGWQGIVEEICDGDAVVLFFGMEEGRYVLREDFGHLIIVKADPSGSSSSAAEYLGEACVEAVHHNEQLRAQNSALKVELDRLLSMATPMSTPPLTGASRGR